VKEQYKEQLQNELTLLQLFEVRKIPLLPRIIDSVEDFLVIQPLGDPFKKFSLKSLINFFKTLKEVHSAGYIHRDIRSTNLIQYHDDVYLIDWGFACKIGENIDFAGKLFLCFKWYTRVSDISKNNNSSIAGLTYVSENAIFHLFWNGLYWKDKEQRRDTSIVERLV